MSARTWAAKACLAIASALLRETAPRAVRIAPVEEDEDDLVAIPPVGMTPAARAMLADGEAWAAMLLEKQLAEKRKEPEKPRRGSVHARIEEAKARRAP